MISFVVPAHNEESLIGETLRAIRAAGEESSRPFEIIVANDASTDRTEEIALRHGARVVSHDARQIAASRNAGGRAARGEFLIFVDADTKVCCETVRAAVAALKGGAVGGGATILFDGELPRWARNLVSTGRRIYSALKITSGCFLFCTRKAFEAVGGFDESLFAAEELAMAVALKRQGRVVVLREPVLTSSRKLLQYSAREILGTLLKIALSGGRGLSSRKGLDLWYGDGSRRSP